MHEMNKKSVFIILALALLNAIICKYIPTEEITAINIRMKKEKIAISFQKINERIEEIIMPIIDVKNNDVSVESVLETSLVII